MNRAQREVCPELHKGQTPFQELDHRAVVAVCGQSSRDPDKIEMDKQNQARLNPACVVCGTQNPNGLHLKFVHDSDGVRANWIPAEGWESFRGVIHGGIVTAVLDEAMSKAILARDWQALTAELRVRFRSRVLPGDSLQVRGWIISRRKRRILAEALLATETGQELAHAWARFLTTPEPAATSIATDSLREPQLCASDG